MAPVHSAARSDPAPVGTRPSPRSPEVSDLVRDSMEVPVQVHGAVGLDPWERDLFVRIGRISKVACSVLF